MTLQEIRNKIFKYSITTSEYYNAWLIDTKDFNNYIYEIKQYLSKAEIQRSEEIKMEKTKLLFCLRKGITRIILSSFFNMSPDEIKYDYNDYGKPIVSHKHYKNLSFNISHSKRYLFVGIVNKGDIGVDVEKINLNLNHSLLAESVFSPEETALYNNYSDLKKMRSFYKAWVQKEAISKALGVGISIGFNKFSVNIDPENNDEQYSLSIDNLNCEIKMIVKSESDYFLAIALI